MKERKERRKKKGISEAISIEKKKSRSDKSVPLTRSRF